MNITKSWTIRLSSVGLAAVLLSGGAAAANAAPIEASTAVSSCTFAQHLVAVYVAAPAELRADIAEVRGMEPGPDRGAAAKGIKARALAGEYGEVTQARVEAFGVYRAANPGKMNQDLKADLGELRATDGVKARLALAEDIAHQAIDGEYGESVRVAAEKIQQSDAWQSCGD